MSHLFFLFSIFFIFQLQITATCQLPNNLSLDDTSLKNDLEEVCKHIEGSVTLFSILDAAIPLKKNKLFIHLLNKDTPLQQSIVCLFQKTLENDNEEIGHLLTHFIQKSLTQTPSAIFFDTSFSIGIDPTTVFGFIPPNLPREKQQTIFYHLIQSLNKNSYPSDTFKEFTLYWINSLQYELHLLGDDKGKQYLHDLLSSEKNASVFIEYLHKNLPETFSSINIFKLFTEEKLQVASYLIKYIDKLNISKEEFNKSKDNIDGLSYQDIDKLISHSKYSGVDELFLRIFIPQNFTNEDLKELSLFISKKEINQNNFKNLLAYKTTLTTVIDTLKSKKLYSILDQIYQKWATQFTLNQKQELIQSILFNFKNHTTPNSDAQKLLLTILKQMMLEDNLSINDIFSSYFFIYNLNCFENDTKKNIFETIATYLINNPTNLKIVKKVNNKDLLKLYIQKIYQLYGLERGINFLKQIQQITRFHPLILKKIIKDPVSHKILIDISNNYNFIFHLEKITQEHFLSPLQLKRRNSLYRDNQNLFHHLKNLRQLFIYFLIHKNNPTDIQKIEILQELLQYVAPQDLIFASEFKSILENVLKTFIDLQPPQVHLLQTLIPILKGSEIDSVLYFLNSNKFSLSKYPFLLKSLLHKTIQLSKKQTPLTDYLFYQSITLLKVLDDSQINLKNQIVSYLTHSHFPLPHTENRSDLNQALLVNQWDRSLSFYQNILNNQSVTYLELQNEFKSKLLNEAKYWEKKNRPNEAIFAYKRVGDKNSLEKAQNIESKLRSIFNFYLLNKNKLKFENQKLKGCTQAEIAILTNKHFPNLRAIVKSSTRANEIKDTTNVFHPENEAIASLINDEMGIDIVPLTVANGNMSIQYYWEMTQSFDAIKGHESPLFLHQKNEMHLFDYLTFNSDRHDDNFLITKRLTNYSSQRPPAYQIVAIDHGALWSRRGLHKKALKRPIREMVPRYSVYLRLMKIDEENLYKKASMILSTESYDIGLRKVYLHSYVRNQVNKIRYTKSEQEFLRQKRELLNSIVAISDDQWIPSLVESFSYSPDIKLFSKEQKNFISKFNLHLPTINYKDSADLSLLKQNIHFFFEQRERFNQQMRSYILKRGLQILYPDCSLKKKTIYCNFQTPVKAQSNGLTYSDVDQIFPLEEIKVVSQRANLTQEELVEIKKSIIQKGLESVWPTIYDL